MPEKLQAHYMTSRQEFLYDGTVDEKMKPSRFTNLQVNRMRRRSLV